VGYNLAISEYREGANSLWAEVVLAGGDDSTVAEQVYVSEYHIIETFTDPDERIGYMKGRN